jgi:hypothetical protein
MCYTMPPLMVEKYNKGRCRRFLAVLDVIGDGRI